MNNENIEFIYPEESTHGFCSSDQIQQWREQGYLFINGMIPNDLIENASHELYQYYSSEEGQQDRLKKDFGGLEFPFKLESKLNDITLHSNILQIASMLLMTDDIRLTQADAWVKFYSDHSVSQSDNRDQRMHIDGWNHTLVAPNSWDSPGSVAMILYLSDSKDTGGETAVVPRQGINDLAYLSSSCFLNTPGAGIVPWINDKSQAEEYYEKNNSIVYEFRQSLYKREKRAKFQKGSLLIYRHDVWHRGTPLTIKDSFRVVLNLSFRRADAIWFQHWSYGWARSMYSSQQTLEKLIARLTVEQRNALGFPKPGDSYWKKETLEAVTQRYQPFGFDSKPYEDAVLHYT